MGKIPVDVDALGVDLLTLAGHKLYAPKGVGALYVRAGTPIAPILFGAGHEQGLRPGTENRAPYRRPRRGGGAGPAPAASQRQIACGSSAMPCTSGSRTRFPALVLNGHPDAAPAQHPATCSFPGVSGRELLARTADVAASVGSACHEADEAVSGVLGAMGIPQKRALGAVRLSIGEPTTDDEIREAADALVATWRSLVAA